MDLPRILTINGSPKPAGHTAGLLDAFERGARGILSCERSNIYEEELPTFSGRLGIETFQPNDVQRKLLEADGFVLATPTYWFSMPGAVKNFIDHLTPLEDAGRWAMEGKVAGVIAYTPQGGGEGILQNLALTFNHMGITVPPYALLFDRGTGDEWLLEDIPLMARSMSQQLRAHRELAFNWDL